jgi:thioesterase domain-containing protein
MLSTGQDNGETDLRELARGHLLTLETAGIRGPVHIAGYSIAAFIALAMAQEAETGGTPVASLTLIDPPDLLMLRAGRPFFAALRAMPFVSRITRKSRAGAQLLALADDERMQRHLALAARHPLKSVDTFVAVGLTRTGRHRRAAFWGKIAANLVLTDLEGTHASIVAGSDASRTARWLETIIEQSDTYAAMNGTSAAPHQED